MFLLVPLPQTFKISNSIFCFTKKRFKLSIASMPLSKISEHELIFLAFDFVPFYQIFPINICACMRQTVLAGMQKSFPTPIFL